MKHEYQDGKIILHGRFWETALYNVANECISVQLDGKAGLCEYYAANKSDNYVAAYVRAAFAVDGKTLDAFAPKTMEMIGRKQKITFRQDGVEFAIEQFLAPSINGLFTQITVQSERPAQCEFSLYCGRYGAKVLSDGRTVSAGEMVLSSSIKGQWIDENGAYYLQEHVAGKKIFHLFLSFDCSVQQAESFLNRFDFYQSQTDAEIESIRFPDSVQTQEEKAFYCSTYFCALENYRKTGDFSGFSAGCRYMNPLRTYYRDGYWTTLSMYKSHIGLVRDEIVTLARGIASDGGCPSAVKSDFSAFWGNHYDSPSFFVMMLYDYVNHSGDRAILTEDNDGKTILEKAVAVLDRLTECADETGLIYKEGAYNKRDWADEVNRNGYVSYVEILYIRALYCLSELLYATGNSVRGDRYHALCQRTKAAFDAILWDEEKGYYVNYKYGDFTEDNFSADTLTAVIFGVCSGDKAKRMLANAEKHLDTRKNKICKADEFGIMCVYPLYRGIASANRKSAQPYDYHNGANWPYWSAVYAYAQSLYGREWKYALMSWFDYNVRKGNYTPVEYFSPCCADGSLLQAWSGLGAFVLDHVGKPSFFAPHQLTIRQDL